MRHELQLRCAPRQGLPDFRHTWPLQERITTTGLPVNCGTLVNASVVQHIVAPGQATTVVTVVCDAEPCQPCGSTHQALVRFFDQVLLDFEESLITSTIWEYFANFVSEGATAGGVAGAIGGALSVGGKESDASLWELLGRAVLGAIISTAVGTALGSALPKKRCVCTAEKDAYGQWVFYQSAA